MADSDDVVDIAQREFEELVGQDTGRVCEPKQRMIRENCPQTHGPRVEDGLMTQRTQTGVAVNNLDLLSDDDISKDGKEREDGGECRLAVNDEERNVVDFYTIRQIANACPAFVGMCYDDDLVSSVDEFCR